MKVENKKNQKEEKNNIEITEAMHIEVIAEKIKAKHGLKEVYITQIGGINIIWRKLKRSEYKESMASEYSENEELAYLEKQDFVAKKVILYPENVEELLEEYAGISDAIAIETMMRTGFGVPKTTTV